MKDYIKGITEDYLTGLSNKGIVKRGHKDYAALGEVPPYMEEPKSITMFFSDVEVVLKNPLSEAVCSCPSKTLCKHIVMAVLAVQAEGSVKPEENTISGQITTEGKSADLEEQADAVEENAARGRITSRNEITARRGMTAESEHTGKETLLESYQDSDMVNLSADYPELCAVPPDRLLRTWGKGSEHTMEVLAKNLLAADITSHASTISVQASGETVTLLEPFSASKCTCKKSSLCSHKAFAALAVRFRYDRVNTELVLAEYLKGKQKKQGQHLADMEESRTQLVNEVRDFLVDFMGVGLNRAPESNGDELMRLSVMSHNVGMPKLEQQLRRLEQEWLHHAKGGGISKVSVFLSRVCSMYALASDYLCGDEHAKEALTGTFRSEYEKAPDIKLYGITSRTYDGKGGFTGNIFYFLDWENGNILTYQDIRPNVYEGRKKTAEAMLKEEAPWGLDIRKEALPGKEIWLKEPKLSADGKLSVSRDTKGEFVGPISLTREMMEPHYYEDFGELLDDCLALFGEEMPGERDRLFFLKPERIAKKPYDEVAQQFSADLYDTEGRVIRLQMDYHKSREYIIRHLERVFDKIEKGQKKELVFFGVVSYGERGLSFYPYEYFDYEVG